LTGFQRDCISTGKEEFLDSLDIEAMGDYQAEICAIDKISAPRIAARLSLVLVSRFRLSMQRYAQALQTRMRKAARIRESKDACASLVDWLFLRA
jgi:hypothetical protein